MLKLKTKTALKNFKGEDFKEGEEVITVGLILTNALSASQENPHRCYILAKKMATEKEIELKAEDVVFLKSTLEKARFTAVIAGQVIEILEGGDSKDMPS